MPDNDFLVEIQTTFLSESFELIEQSESCFLILEKDPKNEENIQKIFRLAHNIKGSAAAVGFDNLSKFAHTIEDLLVKVKNKAIEASKDIINILLKSNDRLKLYIEKLVENKEVVVETNDIEKQIELLLNGGLVSESKPVELKIEPVVKIDLPIDLSAKESVTTSTQVQSTTLSKSDDYVKLPISKIDNLLNYFGEQIILQSTLEQCRIDMFDNKELLNKTIMQLNKITYDLQQIALSLRMFSVRTLYQKMQRIVRDTSVELGKEIILATFGDDTELDKAIMDELSNPLTHIVRNSCDHGIEMPDERASLGKNKQGTISIKTGYKGRNFFIEIQDDGKGLDRNKIIAKALENNLIKKDQQLTDKDILGLIFTSGFSTKDVVTDISGRGVGMDVVKTSIEKMHGHIDIESVYGKGTTILIKLPTTLSIFNGIIVDISGNKYVLPNSDIKEIFRLDVQSIRKVNISESVVDFHGRVMPLVDVKSIINIKSSVVLPKDNINKVVLVTNFQNKEYALVVDEILTQQKIVFKNLGAEAEGIVGIAGATILGDGKVCLILDLAGILSTFKKRGLYDR